MLKSLICLQNFFNVRVIDDFIASYTNNELPEFWLYKLILMTVNHNKSKQACYFNVAK